jgi:hypothetical protein
LGISPVPKAQKAGLATPTPLEHELLQLTLDGARAAEQASVQLIEIVVAGIEHETARNPHGDAGGAVVELDCETLHNFSPTTVGARHSGARERSSIRSNVK